MKINTTIMLSSDQSVITITVIIFNPGRKSRDFKNYKKNVKLLILY